MHRTIRTKLSARPCWKIDIYLWTRIDILLSGSHIRMNKRLRDPGKAIRGEDPQRYQRILELGSIRGFLIYLFISHAFALAISLKVISGELS